MNANLNQTPSFDASPNGKRARRTNTRRAVMVIATVLLMVGVVASGLALTFNRTTAKQATTATTVPQRATWATTATPAEKAAEGRQKQGKEGSVIVNPPKKDATAIPEPRVTATPIDDNPHQRVVFQTVTSPYDGSEISIASSENVAMLIRRGPGAAEAVTFFELQGYEFTDLLALPNEPSVIVRMFDPSGTGDFQSGIHRVSFDGDGLHGNVLITDIPASDGVAGSIFKPYAISPDQQYLVAYRYWEGSDLTCNLTVVPFEGGPTFSIYPHDNMDAIYPITVSACSYASFDDAGNIYFSVTEAGHPANVLEDWRVNLSTGDQEQLNSYIAPEEPIDGPPAPPPVTEGKFAILGVSEETVNDFLHFMQERVTNDDREGLAQYVVYPLNVTIDGATQQISSPEEFVEHYDAIMNDEVREALLNQNPDDLFVNQQGIMVGNGQIWFSPTQPGVMQIIGINN